MTQFKPCLIVNRLIVKRGSHIAYDETFHKGVNIIRGDNSSGKSTILNFVFYGLGGDLNKLDWSEHALMCDYVWLEAEFNGKPAVLRRAIDVSSMSSMEIIGGRYSQALLAPVENWVKYPYARSKNMESFSQAIFRLLEMPDVAVEGTSNLTIHQILRLLYADQLTPVDSLFRYEGYDPENLREAVGNLLCGAFDAEIYELQQLQKSKEKEFSDVSAELKSIIRVVGGDESLSVQWIEQKRKSFIEEREKLLNAISISEAEFYASKSTDRITIEAQKALYKEVQRLQVSMQDARTAIDGIEFEVADSKSFIATLQRRLDALKDAGLAAELVPAIRFGTCPACYADVLESDDEIAACHLCKTPVDAERARERVVGLINELSIQIKQSERLQIIRDERRQGLIHKYNELTDAWKLKANELSELSVLPTSKVREKIRELHRKLGYIDKSIEDIERQVRLANKIGDLSARKSELDQEIQSLASRVVSLKRNQTDQLRKARKAIEENVIELLKGDLKRQDSFENPQRVDFSFAKNSITVDDHTYFSASSRVVLKTAFLVGFLAAALIHSSFRHPRFLMVDITEDKGMEQERSYNFQRQVIDLSNRTAVEHQVILATAMPAPDIDEKLFVGEYSTLEKGTLNFLSSKRIDQLTEQNGES
ncbi:AAA family ATPase [Kordiimonas sp.]|uniref:AAA family ATPase n=1 Tax=Kordiimonas sp. TaxID=1970157 RepID=UPI003A8D71BE